mmetsp:Transcript_25953/g.45875  ORF Transcript_25953/g.45875 Transcript_25953/m.45875 type:complete len:86 (+) Transcript_25953:2356-2613(+)
MRHLDLLRKYSHYLLLLGVSCSVVYAMERKLSQFGENVKYSTTEREYRMKKQHKQIMDSLVPYDGRQVPLERKEEKLPRYRHEED